ncbi:MAG: AAA family ATPase [Candidatus Hydrogenedentes bacterium]|nr:AAA family ATPase [Candidatus Hydrogenedentota bacterium]
MYLNYYGLAREPFHIATTPGLFFMGKNHREALAMMMYGVQKRLGFIMLTGEVGTGKTTVLRAYLEHVERTNVRSILLFNPELDFRGLLIHILQTLGVDGRGKDERWLLHCVANALAAERKAGRLVVLIVDEAHHLPVETLRRMHLLSNMEARDGKLLQVIFVGQPEFDSLMLDGRLRQIRQRTAVRFHLKPLTQRESAEYIRFRLEWAGGTVESCFARSAIRRIIKEADGFPRMLNVLCDNALITGMGHDVKPVSRRVVCEIIRDFRTPRRRSFRWWTWSRTADETNRGQWELVR